MIYALAFVLGALAWTLTEYWLHRGWGHRGEAKNPFSVEHLAHHADVSYFAPTYKKAIAAVAVAGSTGSVLFLLLGDVGLAASAGFVVMYITYEVIHRRLHTHAGRGRYGRWARRHHLYHHYRRPQLNHGVTSPLWDFVFRTLEVPEIVKVPRRNALAWMLRDDGELRDELADEYLLIGRVKKQKAEAA
jgi:sterol desaturase/sphingolipid hydroxylase (fatty acid hydroxylase superfamily)